MFPRAHAAAYSISAMRAGYYKVYFPLEFYAALFTIDGIDHFDIELCCKGYGSILGKILGIEEKGVAAAAKEKASLGVLESALEMTARGFKFKPVDLYRSDATKFRIDETDRRSLIPPFAAVQGISANTAIQIANAREDGEFVSVEDFRKRTKVSRTVIETLERLGCFRGMSASNQLALF